MGGVGKGLLLGGGLASKKGREWWKRGGIFPAVLMFG